MRWIVTTALIVLAAVSLRAAEPLQCGTPLNTTLCEPGEIDEYSLSLPASTLVTLQVTDRFGAIGLMRLRVVDAEGTVLHETCTGRVETRLGLGNYRVEVSDCIGTSTGEYSLILLADRGNDMPSGLAATANGSRLYVAMGGSNALAVYDFTDVRAPKLVDHFPVADNPVDVKLSRDGRRAYVVDAAAYELAVIDTETGKVTARYPLAANANQAVVSPDGESVYVANCQGFCGSPPYDAGGTFNVVHPAEPPPQGASVFTTIDGFTLVTYGPIGITLSPDGSRLYSYAAGSGNVAVADVAQQGFFASIPVRALAAFDNAHGGIAVSPDGRSLYVVDALRSLSVIDAESMTVRAQIDFAEPDFSNFQIRLNDVAVSPDGSRIYVTFDAQDINLSWVWAFNAATHATIGIHLIGLGSRPHVVLADEGRRAYASTEWGPGGTIAAIDLTTGTVLSSLSATVPAGFTCAQLANDHCAQATEISNPSFVSFLDAGSNEEATKDDSDPAPVTCAGGRDPRKNVWYRFTAPSDGIVTADTIGSTYNTVLVAYAGSCENLTEIECNDLAYPQVRNEESLVSTRVNAGEDYFFLVNDFHGSGALLSFNMTFQPDTPTPVLARPPQCNATRSLTEACPGDCNGDRSVAVDELIRGTNIGLASAAMSSCTAMDANGDGSVSVDELVAAVDAALNGCD